MKQPTESMTRSIVLASALLRLISVGGAWAAAAYTQRMAPRRATECYCRGNPAHRAVRVTLNIGSASPISGEVRIIRVVVRSCEQTDRARSASGGRMTLRSLSRCGVGHQGVRRDRRPFRLQCAPPRAIPGDGLAHCASELVTPIGWGVRFDAKGVNDRGIRVTLLIATRPRQVRLSLNDAWAGYDAAVRPFVDPRQVSPKPLGA